MMCNQDVPPLGQGYRNTALSEQNAFSLEHCILHRCVLCNVAQ